jgi:hypothetical protein
VGGPAKATFTGSAPANVPMIVAVYLANAPRMPAQGALTKPTVSAATIDAELFARTVAALEDEVPLPKGATVVAGSPVRKQ